jgi:hypothetical protein
MDRSDGIRADGVPTRKIAPRSSEATTYPKVAVILTWDGGDVK